MITQQIKQTVVGGRQMGGGWILGFALVVLVTLLVAGWLTVPAPARQASAI